MNTFDGVLVIIYDYNVQQNLPPKSLDLLEIICHPGIVIQDFET